jgi:hypothetical protein
MAPGRYYQQVLTQMRVNDAKWHQEPTRTNKNQQTSTSINKHQQAPTSTKAKASTEMQTHTRGQLKDPKPKPTFRTPSQERTRTTSRNNPPQSAYVLDAKDAGRAPAWVTQKPRSKEVSRTPPRRRGARLEVTKPPQQTAERKQTGRPQGRADLTKR